jgi:hypothetical protein
VVAEDCPCGRRDGCVVLFPCLKYERVAIRGFLGLSVAVEFGAVQFAHDEMNRFSETLGKGFTASACKLLGVGVEGEDAFCPVWDVVWAVASAMRGTQNDREFAALHFDEFGCVRWV